MSTRPVGLAALLLSTTLSSSALAASAWTPLGPPGGNVYALVADPSAPGTLYASVHGGGILKTTDGGATWTVSSQTMRGWSVHALAIAPARPRTLYAGTWDKGVWKTTDAGATWKQVLGGDRQAAVLGLVIDPKNPQNIYAATDTGPNDGVHRSSDGGATWKRSTEGLPSNFRLYAIAIDPKIPTTLYLTPGDGVFKSVDGGATWKATGSGISGKAVPSARGRSLLERHGVRRDPERWDVPEHRRRRELDAGLRGPNEERARL